MKPGMPSKVTPVKESVEVKHRFTCPYCGSHGCTAVSGEGRIAARFDKIIVCMNCGKVIGGTDIVQARG